MSDTSLLTSPATQPEVLTIVTSDRKPVTFTHTPAGLSVVVGGAQPITFDRWNAATLAQFFRSV